MLKHLSLTIWRGQKVAFCGFSGSGKSTVIQLLLSALARPVSQTYGSHSLWDP